MANVFFSLHVVGIDAPVYVSETVTRTMDPTFRSLDLSRCSPSTLRQSKVVVRIWMQSLSTLQWRMLSDTEVSLDSLQYIDKSLAQCRHTLEPNVLLFQFTDGVYTMPTAMSHPSAKPAGAQRVVKPGRTLRTSSFDALL